MAQRSKTFRKQATNRYQPAHRVQLMKTQNTLTKLLNLNHSADVHKGKMLVLNIWHQYQIPTQLGYSVPAIDTHNFRKYWMQVGPKFEIEAMYDMMTENAQTKCPVIPRIFGSGYFQHSGEACLVMKHYGLNLSACTTLSKLEKQRKIDYVRRQLKKYKIPFQEEDLTESNILFTKPKRDAQNREGVTIIYLSCNDPDGGMFTEDTQMTTKDAQNKYAEQKTQHRWLKAQTTIH